MIFQTFSTDSNLTINIHSTPDEIKNHLVFLNEMLTMLPNEPHRSITLKGIEEAEKLLAQAELMTLIKGKPNE